VTGFVAGPRGRSLVDDRTPVSEAQNVTLPDIRDNQFRWRIMFSGRHISYHRFTGTLCFVRPFDLGVRVLLGKRGRSPSPKLGLPSVP
jgi:hypothetical protein